MFLRDYQQKKMLAKRILLFAKYEKSPIFWGIFGSGFSSLALDF